MGGYIFSEQKEDIDDIQTQQIQKANKKLRKFFPPKALFDKNYNFDIMKDISGIEKLENYGILPVRNLNMIFQFCTRDGLLNCSCSCELFYRIIQCSYFWQAYYKNHFPKHRSENDDSEVNWKQLFFYKCFSFKAKDEFYKKLFFTPPPAKSKTRSPKRGSFDVLFKFLLIGNMGVGKSSLLRRYSDGIFNHSGYISTIGVDFKIRTANYDDQVIKLQLWDTAGQERFRTITQSYYRGAHGILICFSIDSLDSFEGIKNWVEGARENGDKDCPIVFVGCKNDLECKRAVDKEHHVRRYLESEGFSFSDDYCECSSKDDLFIHLPFGMLLEKCLRRKFEFEDEEDYSKDL